METLLIAGAIIVGIVLAGLVLLFVGQAIAKFFDENEDQIFGGCMIGFVLIVISIVVGLIALGVHVGGGWGVTIIVVTVLFIILLFVMQGKW